MMAIQHLELVKEDKGYKSKEKVILRDKRRKKEKRSKTSLLVMWSGRFEQSIFHRKVTRYSRQASMVFEELRGFEEKTAIKTLSPIEVRGVERSRMGAESRRDTVLSELIRNEGKRERTAKSAVKHFS